MKASDKADVYRFPVPQQLTNETLLHAAQRLAEATRSGYDICKAQVDGRFIAVPLRGLKPLVTDGRVEFVRPKRRTAEYREQILAALRRNGPMTVGEVCKAVGLTDGQGRYLLQTLVDAGSVGRRNGLFGVE